MAANFCSEDSADAGEALAGTAAAGIDHWICLELDDVWAAKPLESPALAGQPRRVLESWIASVPRTRLQLIKRGRVAGSAVTLIVGSSAPGDGWLAMFALNSLAELAELDFAEIVAARGAPGVSLDWVHLICTHGKRDQCCAKRGLPLYNAMVALEPERVWQTSHLGGHRFAPTTLSLPLGICYGRLEVADAGSLVAADRDATLFRADCIRGRTAYTPAEQAAEVSVLKDEAGTGLPALVGSVEEGGGVRVVFTVGDQECAVLVSKEPGQRDRRKSCADDGLAPMANFVVTPG